MITREDVLSLGYLKKAVFHGSYRGMRFQLQKDSLEDETILKVYAWPEPFTFGKTPDEQKISQHFPFSNEGLDGSIQWLNEVYPSVKKNS